MYAGSWGGDGLFKTTDGGLNWYGIPYDDPSWFRNMEVYDIAIDPSAPETIWVANGHYVDVSRNGGLTWQTFYFADDEDRFCYSVAVDPFDSDTVYVGTGGPDNIDENGEIFITRNGSEETPLWEKWDFSDTFLRDSFWQLAFNPNKQGEVWAANRKSYLSSAGMVCMTADNGKNWNCWQNAKWPDDGYFYSFGYVDEVLVHPTDPNQIFLGCGEGIIFKESADKDWTWTWSDVLSSCRALCMLPGYTATLYAGLSDEVVTLSDNGTRWKKTNSYEAPGEFITMEPHPSNEATLFAGNLNLGIFQSSDRAQNWTAINTGIKANTVFDTAVDPANYERLLAGTLAGVYIRENAVAGWQQINSRGANAVAFHPAESDTLYAGFDWCIGKSTDGGESWSYIDTPDDENPNDITSLAIDAAGSTVYAAVSFSSGKKGQLLKFKHTAAPFPSDATPTVLLQTPVPLNCIAISPHDPSFMIVVSGSFYSPTAPGALYISRNGGQSWHKKILFGRYALNSIAFDPADPDIIYAGGGSSGGSFATLLKSTNGGLNWTPKTGGLPESFAVKDMQVTADGEKVYAVLYKGYSENESNLGGIYVSLDGGDYWTRVGLSDYRMHDISLAQVPAVNSSLNADSPMPVNSGITYTAYVGTGSGLMNEDPSTIAGTGIVSGLVTSTEGDPIPEAYLSVSSGTGCQSDHGFYLMLCPSGQYTIRASAPGYTQISSTSLTIQAGQSVEQNIVMEPYNDNATTCISANLLKNTAESRDLKPLRAFRDGVLKKTPLGKEIISRYYALGKDIMPILLRNAGLRETCKKLIGHSAAIIRARAGKPLILPAGFMDEANAFLCELEKNAPPGVQKKLIKLRSDMRHFKLDRLQVKK